MVFIKALLLGLLIWFVPQYSYANDSKHVKKVFLAVLSTDGERALVSEYKKRAGPIMKQYGGKMPPLSFKYSRSIHGSFAYDSLLLVEFPNRSAIEKAFNDPNYKRLIELRKRAFKALGIFVFQK